jgi:hypothetical protein
MWYCVIGWRKATSVLWLWLSAVLHYSWTVIRLIALHWKEDGQSQHLSQLTGGRVWNIGNLGYPPDSADHDDKGHALTRSCVLWFTTPPRISFRQFSAWWSTSRTSCGHVCSGSLTLRTPQLTLSDYITDPFNSAPWHHCFAYAQHNQCPWLPPTHRSV